MRVSVVSLCLVISLMTSFGSAQWLPKYVVEYETNLKGYDAADPPYGISDDDYLYTDAVKSRAGAEKRGTTPLYAQQMILNSAKKIQIVNLTQPPNAKFYEITAVASIPNALPLSYQKLGYKIGDIDWFGPHAVAPWTSNVSNQSAHIAVYNTVDLSLRKTVKSLWQSSMPWVSLFYVDVDTEFIVTSNENNVDSVFVYSWPELNYVATIPLQVSTPNQPLQRVKGGVVRVGLLYLSTDQQANDGRDFYIFNLSAAFPFTPAGYAPLLSSERVQYQQGKGETCGTTFDASGLLWVVSWEKETARGTLNTLVPAP